MSTPPSLSGKWIELKDRAVFRITGPDRVRYLNGQVTNDVSGPLQEESVAACLCTLKGKVEALVWISADEDSILIDGQLDQREEILSRLDRYLIADDCEIQDETGQSRLIHHFDASLGGAQSRRTLERGRDLWTREESIDSLQRDKMLTPDEFAIAQLFARIPLSPFEITANEFPAELGLDSWAVDFGKGCYLGQEVISRIKSVGKVKRRLSLVVADSSIAQNAHLRNSQDAAGIATRDSVALGEKIHYALALFSDKPIGSEVPDVQLVEERGLSTAG